MYSIVIVRHNLVEEIRYEDSLKGQAALLRTNLEAGSLLSQNFQRQGCIDGDYWFDDPERSKVFASICMDFVKKLLEKRIEIIDQLSQEEEYVASKVKTSLLS